MNRKSKLFGILYGLALFGFTGYVLLYTFVIPRSGSAIVSAQSTASASSTETAAADTSASTDSASDTATAASDAVITDTSYTDDNISISLTTETLDDTQVYVVDIQVSDVSYLQSAFAEATYGRNITDVTSSIAAENNAILASNGDYDGFRDTGYVLRNGSLYRDKSSGADDLVLGSDGTMYIANEDETTAEDLYNSGALQVWSFGPALVNDGEIVVGENEDVDQATSSNPRTAIGMVSPLHYVIVVSDGRTDESEGLSLYALAGVLQDNGCTVAYNLDGGGSTTLYFNGEVINNPVGGHDQSSERKVSDIVYIGY